MPYNGSGSYSLPAGNPVSTGSTISSTTHNNTMSDVASALSNALTKDGQSTPSANIKMGGFKHTNLADGSAAGDSVNLGQVQDGAYALLGTVSGADTITAAAAPALTAYAAGQTFRFVSAGANTGAATLNIDALGAKAITKQGAAALAAGDIPSGAVCEVVYDGTQFQLIGATGAENINLAAGKNIVFEGTTDDAFETTLSAGDPTADRTITMPDRSGTVPVGDGTEVGDVIYSVRTSGRAGFLKSDGRTIGNSSSGATALASTDALALFTVLWNESSNTDLQIQTSGGVVTSRGASAAADWAANKRMPMPNMPGNFIRSLNSAGSGVDASRANLSTQSDAFASHTHTFQGANVSGPGTAYGSDGPPVSAGARTTDATGGTETRPRNIAMTAWIRYLPYQL